MTNVGARLLAKASFRHKKSLNRDKTNQNISSQGIIFIYFNYLSFWHKSR